MLPTWSSFKRRPPARDRYGSCASQTASGRVFGNQSTGTRGECGGYDGADDSTDRARTGKERPSSGRQTGIQPRSRHRHGAALRAQALSAARDETPAQRTAARAAVWRKVRRRTNPPPQDAERCYFDACASDLDPRAGDLGRQAGGYRPPCRTANATTPFRDAGASERAASVGRDPGPTGWPGVGTSSAGGHRRNDAETLERAQLRTAREALGRYANRGTDRPLAGATAARAYCCKAAALGQAAHRWEPAANPAHSSHLRAPAPALGGSRVPGARRDAPAVAGHRRTRHRHHGPSHARALAGTSIRPVVSVRERGGRRRLESPRNRQTSRAKSF